MGREVEYKGKIYKNRADLARELNIGVNRIWTRLSKGMSLEEAVEDAILSERRVKYGGKEYNNITELARAFNINVNVLNKRLGKGMGLEEALVLPVKTPNSTGKVEYKGKEYGSIKELASALDISYTTLYKKIKSGIRLEEAIRNHSRRSGKIPIEYSGRKYESIKELAEEVGINYNTIRSRLGKLRSIEEVVGRPVYRGKDTRRISRA